MDFVLECDVIRREITNPTYPPNLKEFSGTIRTGVICCDVLFETLYLMNNALGRTVPSGCNSVNWYLELSPHHSRSPNNDLLMERFRETPINNPNIHANVFTLKMEAARPSEKLVSYHITTRCHKLNTMT
jgi:hypothetical protein